MLYGLEKQEKKIQLYVIILLQVVGPSDGSSYIVDYYGAGLVTLTSDNNTYIKPPEY